MKGEVQPEPKDKRGWMAMAKQYDAEIRRECALVQKSLARLAEMLGKMHEFGLWQYLRDPAHNGDYKRFEDYAEAVLGPIGRTKVYALLAIRELTNGPNPIPPETIEKIGRVKATELARLSPEQRTPEMLKCALEHSVPVVKQRVQEAINKTLPPEERKELLTLFARNLPSQLIEVIEEIEEDGVWMEGVRDGDMSLTLRAKLWFAVWTNFRANFQEELDQGRKYRLALQAKNAKAAPKNGEAAGVHQVEEADDGPPEPEEFTETTG